MKARISIITIALILLAGLLAGSAFANMYYLADHPGVTLFWKGDEVYLFLGGGHTGYHFKYIQYPVVALKEYFFSPPIPNDNLASMIALRVTPATIEKHEIKFTDAATAPHFLTPSGNGFYAMCRGAVLCKWAGNGFDPATKKQDQEFGGIDRLFRGDITNRVINGWSVRQLRRSPGDQFDVNIENKFIISAKNDAVGIREYPKMSVVMTRSSQPPQMLYNVDGAPRSVSKTEYEKIF